MLEVRVTYWPLTLACAIGVWLLGFPVRWLFDSLMAPAWRTADWASCALSPWFRLQGRIPPPKESQFPAQSRLS